MLSSSTSSARRLTLAIPAEVLPQSPSRWYSDRISRTSRCTSRAAQRRGGRRRLDSAGEPGGDDDSEPEPSAAAKQKYLPSSIGVSVLLPKEAKTLTVRVTWGDYKLKTDTPGSEEWSKGTSRRDPDTGTRRQTRTPYREAGSQKRR